MFFHALSHSHAIKMYEISYTTLHIFIIVVYITPRSSKAFHLLDLEYSTKIFVSGYSLEPSIISLGLGRAGSVTTVGLSINRCSHSELTSLTRENKIDQSRNSGFGDFKGSMRFRQSLLVCLFSSSLNKTKGGSDRRVRILLTLKANSSHLA